MKSLTIFILICIMSSCLVYTYSQAKNSNKKDKNVLKTKKPFSLPEQKKKMTLTKGDLETCKTGKNLGLLEVGMSCNYKYSNFCEKVLIRDKNLPPMTKLKQARLASQGRKNSNKSLTLLKRKKKWSLKARTDKFKKKQKNRNRKNFGIKNPKKASKNNEKKKRLRAEAKFVANKIMSKGRSLRTRTKKSLKKEAKKLVSKITYGDMNSVKKSLNLPVEKKQKKKKSEKKIDNNGKFCVQSVVWNLSHCCYFTNRMEAQEFANTQPIKTVFNKRLVEGWVAQMKDDRKAATKVIGNAANAIKILDKKRREMKKLNQNKDVDNGNRKAGKKAKNKNKKN